MAEKHNRLDSQFSLVCAFWTPASPENITTGTLEAGKRHITFTTSPIYSKPIPSIQIATLRDRINRAEISRQPVMHGFTEDGLCTLCQVDEVDNPGLSDYRSGQSIEATQYRAVWCISGMHLDGANDKCISSARYTFSGISEWLPSAVDESWESDQVVIRVPMKETDFASFSTIKDRLKIGLKLYPELKNSDDDDARVSRSVPYVEVESPVPNDLAWYHQIGNRLENFFSLLTGSSLALETFFVCRYEDSGNVITKRTNGHMGKFNPHDCVRCTPSQIASAIAIWLGESPQFIDVESVALGVARKGNLFVETEFLTLAQALEGFHRVTCATARGDKTRARRIRRKIAAILNEENVETAQAERICSAVSYAFEPTFASRLTELCERLSSHLLFRMELDPKDFVSNVVNTRNFYTHAGSSSKKRQKRTPVTGGKLFLLNVKMQTLLRGVMLRHLGIPEEQLAGLLIRLSTRWR